MLPRQYVLFARGHGNIPPSKRDSDGISVQLLSLGALAAPSILAPAVVIFPPRALPMGSSIGIVRQYSS